MGTEVKALPVCEMEEKGCFAGHSKNRYIQKFRSLVKYNIFGEKHVLEKVIFLKNEQRIVDAALSYVIRYSNEIYTQSTESRLYCPKHDELREILFKHGSYFVPA